MIIWLTSLCSCADIGAVSFIMFIEYNIFIIILYTSMWYWDKIIKFMMTEKNIMNVNLILWAAWFVWIKVNNNT